MKMPQSACCLAARSFLAPLGLLLLFGSLPGNVRARLQGSSSGNVQVRVKSTERQEAVAGAEVIMIYAGRMESNLNSYTDASGRVTFDGIRTGSYEIVVEKDGYETARERVIISPGVRENFFIQLRPRAEASARGAAASTTSARKANVPEPARKAYEEGMASLKDDPAKSIEHFRRAIEAFPAYPEAYLMLGYAQLRRGEKTQALGALDRAIELDPKLAQAHLLIGKIHLEDKKLVEAETPLRQSVGLDPHSWEGHFHLSRCLYNTNKLDEALRHAQRAQELPGASPLTHLLLSDIHTARNEKKEAVRELEAFIRADPKSPLVPRARQMIERLHAAGGGAEKP